MPTRPDPFCALASLSTSAGAVRYYRLRALDSADIEALPFTIRILLENLLRRCDGDTVTEEHVRSLAGWSPTDSGRQELPFMPARVLLQDFTGVPVVADLAAVRSEVARQGGDPQLVNPDLAIDLVVDRSVQVDAFGIEDAFRINVDREYERNGPRYAFLR